MYNFIDTNEVSESVILPSEALRINGEYIENLIPGYRTVQVEGREALSPDVVTHDIGIRDGSQLKSKRYPERIIVVTYQLMAHSNEEFREAYNKLASILDVENAELIFNDEQDKFFIGTPCVIGAVTPGTNAVIGKIEFLCTDPFKYSVIEYEATPNIEDSSVLINYNGTYKAFPTLETDFYKESEIGEDGEINAFTEGGDCGYVAFFNEDEKIIQLGDPEEYGAELYPKSQTLINQAFDNSLSWGSAAQSLWTLNGANIAPYTSVQAGAVAMGSASFTKAESFTTEGYLLGWNCTTDVPHFNYKIHAKTSSRTANTIKVTFTITTSLEKKENYFGTKRGLKGIITVNDSSCEFMIKKESEYWRGNSAHTVTKSLVVEGLDADTTVLDDIKFTVERTDDLGSAGKCTDVKCKELEIPRYIAPETNEYFLAPSSYGSDLKVWHGPAITRAIPADKAGEVGASEFEIDFKLKFGFEYSESQSFSKALGCIGVYLHDAAGKIIGRMRLEKKQDGTNAKLICAADTSTEYTKAFTVAREPSPGNTAFVDQTVMNVSIQTEGARIKFNVSYKNTNNKWVNLTGYPPKKSVKGVKVAFITFMFEQYSATPALKMGLYSLKFRKTNCETYKDVPNKFSANDVLEADCKSGDIRLNGISRPDLGALGNNWEEFCLTPGLNQIGVAYSDWVADAYAPTFKVRYREVFL